MAVFRRCEWLRALSVGVLHHSQQDSVSRSFLCLWFVVSQSVMLVERLFFAEQNALCGEDVRLCVGACVLVGCDKNYYYYYYYFIIIIVAATI